MRSVLVLIALSSVGAFAQNLCTPPPTPPTPTMDALSDTRVLRRIALVLTGTTPDVAEYEALAAATTPQARQRALDDTIDAMLKSPKFYEQMVQFGHEWITNGPYTKGAQGDAYQGDMSGHLFSCESGTIHQYKLYLNSDPDAWPSPDYNNICNDKDRYGAAKVQAVVTIEPWWAPGTTVQVVGTAGGSVTQVPGPNSTTLDCGLASVGYYDPDLPTGCGCGPNLIWCAPLSGLSSGSMYALKNKQRRHPFEEPARLLAHIAWYDRELTDLVLGNYSVGTNWLRHLYVRWGRQQGPASADQNTTWWKPASDTGPHDPLHLDGDIHAWREFVVEDLNPYILALTPGKAVGGGLGRTFSYDPRTTTAAAPGIPAAGVLTMLGPNSSWPRERVRAARYLETFACSSFSPPPAGATFPPYDMDPATGGTCMHCHRTLDPAAIAFKRWDFGSSAYVQWPFLGGVGRFRMTSAWLSGQYPYSGNHAGFRWRNAFVPGTVMTPVTPAEVAANPEAVLLDTMPSTYTLLGASGDGTMGPLGFGRLLVQSGEFDRCAVRRIYTRVVGRDLHPSDERAYLDKLVGQFVQDGRKMRPFIKHLMTQPEFRRGL